MKTFIWLIIVTFVMTCLACWAISHVLVATTFSRMGILMPWFTQLILYPNFWILVCPVPWLIYAMILSRRPDLSRRSALIFAGSVATAALLLVGTVVIACTLPLMVFTNGVA